MAIQPQRLIIRGILILAIVGAATLGVMNYRVIQPGYMWEQAQLAMAEGDYAAAEIHLQKLLRVEPKHLEAHLAMVDVILLKAEAEGEPATIVENPAALERFGEAAELAPDNPDLQRRYLSYLVDTFQLRRAVPIAQRVIAAEEENTDALYVLAWQALEQRDFNSAREMTQRLARAEPRPSLRTLALQMQLYNDTKEEESLQETLSKSIQLTSDLSDDDLLDLYLRDPSMLTNSMGLAVVSAASAEEADRRAELAVGILERVSRLRGDDDETARVLGETAANMLWMLAKNHPLAIDAEVGAKLAYDKRQRIRDRAEKLCQAAVAARTAAPVVYQLLADAAFSRNEDDRGLEIIERGIAASMSLPIDRREEAQHLHLAAASRLILLRQTRDVNRYLQPLLSRESTAGLAHLLAGQAAIIEGRLEDAEKAFGEARKLVGDTFNVNMQLANVYMREGKFREALPHLEALKGEFSKVDSDELALINPFLRNEAEVNLAMAVAYIGIGQLNAALKQLEALQGTPLEPNAHHMRFGFFMQQEKYDEALEYIRTVRLKFPRDFTLFNDEFQVRVAMGEREEAVESLEAFANTNSDNLEAQVQLVRLRVAQGRIIAAHAILDEFIERRPHWHKIKLIKAILYLAEGKLPEVEALVAELEQIPETRVRAAMLGAQVALRKQNLDEAYRMLQLASNADGRNATVRYWQAALSSIRGDHEDAIDGLAMSLGVSDVRGAAQLSLLQSLMRLASSDGPAEAHTRVVQLLKEYPFEPVLLLAKADLELQQGEFDTALRTLDQLERRKPNSPSTAHLKARAWYLNDDLTKALAEIRRALRLDPKHLASRLLAAEIHLARNESEEALELTAGVLEEKPNLWEVYLMQAEALFQQRRAEDGQQVLVALIAEQPQMVDAYMALAASQIGEGDFTGALATVRSGRRQVPDDAKLLNGEIELLTRLGRIEELARVEPESDQAAYLKSVAWLAINRTDLALAEAERAIRLNPQHAPAREVAARICVERGDDEDALIHATAALRVEPDRWSAQILVAQALGLQGRQQEALDVMRDLVQRHPPVGEVHLAMANALAAMGDIDQAIAALHRGRSHVPQDLDLVSAEVELLCEADKVNDARKAAERLSKEAKQLEVDLTLARTFLRVEQYSLARYWGQRAARLAVKEKRPMVRALLGDIAIAEGMKTKDSKLLAEARDHFLAVVEADPLHMYAGNNLALLMVNEYNDPHRALDIVERTRGSTPIEQMPGEFIDTVSVIYRKLNRHTELQGILQRAITVNPNHPLIHYQLGLTLLEIGQRDPARESLNRALQLGLTDEAEEEAREQLALLTPPANTAP